MAHQCRTCGEAHFATASAVTYPLPDRLALIDPLLPDLIEAAREFVSFGPGDALEFVQWLTVDVQRAAGMTPGRRPVSHRRGVAA
jgi:hypothetical protein